MDDDELQIDPDYKKGFNLAYTLQTQGGEDHYKDLETLAGHYPDLKQQALFQGMEAGKAQAVTEQENMMNDMYRDSLVGDHRDNRNEILDQPYYDGHEEKIEAVEQQQKDQLYSTRPLTLEEQQKYNDAKERFEKREQSGQFDDGLDGPHEEWESRQPITPEEQKQHDDFAASLKQEGQIPLTPEQQQELTDHDKWMEDSKERQDFKDASRRINVEGKENSDALERGDFDPKEEDKEEKQPEKPPEKEQSSITQKLTDAAMQLAEETKQWIKDLQDKRARNLDKGKER